MKLIIDINEEIYKDIMAHNREMREGGKSAYYFEGLIQNGTPIPDNATNGEVIKALFPTADISLNDSCFEGVVNKYGFDMNWWNRLYQKGGKE